MKPQYASHVQSHRPQQVPRIVFLHKFKAELLLQNRRDDVADGLYLLQNLASGDTVHVRFVYWMIS